MSESDANYWRTEDLLIWRLRKTWKPVRGREWFPVEAFDDAVYQLALLVIGDPVREAMQEQHPTG